MSRSPSPSSKQTVFVSLRVTLMMALVRSCSPSLETFSRFVPRSTTRIGHGPFTSNCWAFIGLLRGSTKSTFTFGERAWYSFSLSWPEAMAALRWK